MPRISGLFCEKNMAKQTVNPGTAPTGVGGDTFRSGSAKLQANDDEIYGQLGADSAGKLPTALPLTKGGTGATTAAAARANLGITLGLSTGNFAAYDAGGLSGLGYGGKSIALPVGQDFATYPWRIGWYSLSGVYPNAPLTTTMSSIVRSSIRAFGSGMALVFEIFQGYRAYIGFCSSYVSNTDGTVTPSSDIRWQTHYTTGNTTVDANGFIKAASPIVQLFANHIKLNNEAEQQEITFEKLDIGDYLIKGSTGFAQEGWYVEQPKDANGNVLVAVVYEQLENNDISVKTFKKKFDLETASIVADLNNPIDIIEGRWIDLRLQELPQPEVEDIEVTDGAE